MSLPMPFLLFSVLFSCTPINTSSITFPKPSPCYEISDYRIEGRVIRIFLKAKEGVCPQIITEDRLQITSSKRKNLERVEVYLGERLWKGFKLY